MVTTGATTLAGNRFLQQASRLLAPLLALALGACVASPTRLEQASLARSVPAADAIALPPPGGPAVVGVVERRYANAIQQDIALGATTSVPGQNLMRVQMFGPVGSDGSTTRLPDHGLREAELRREMRAALPGIAMQRSPLYVQNGYGPFGYATGTSGRNRCIYAWQRIVPNRGSSPFSSRGSVQMRLRVCQIGASERGLLALMYGYTINSSFSGFGWNPYGTPSAADPRLGQTGKPIVPASSGGFDAMLDPPPAPPVPRRSATPRRVPAVPTPAAPPAGAPIVPPPPRIETVPAPIVPPPPSR
ncbi:cellulose biosynthesis protein BcsN [Mesorhizobium sp. CAU 1741]|uniref:cellulose biosynthesis protein BcsN n=1 Tax=Mesorhizobium sp. CAU 1741 TaxID=3140366 RepID=UPI00325B007E